MSRKKRRNRRTRNLGSMVMVSLIVAMLIIVISVKSNELEEKKTAYEKKESYLLEQIDEQYARAEEIEEYRKYMQTKQYVEDMARQKLGLVYKDEIIFEADN